MKSYLFAGRIHKFAVLRVSSKATQIARTRCSNLTWVEETKVYSWEKQLGI